MLGFTLSSALIGTIIGFIAISRPADAFGRRSVLCLLALFYSTSAADCAPARDWWMFMASRFVGGLPVGWASLASLMYIAEVSPARCRGRLMADTQFNVDDTMAAVGQCCTDVSEDEATSPRGIIPRSRVLASLELGQSCRRRPGRSVL